MLGNLNNTVAVIAIWITITATLTHGGSGVYTDAVLADNPIAYFKLDETSGSSTAVNRVDPARSGVYTAGIRGANYTLGQTSPIVTEPGNTAVSFDGDSGWIVVDDQPAGQTPDILNFETEDQWTLELWLNRESSFFTGNPAGKLNADNNASNYFFHMGIGTVGKVRWHTNGFGGNQVDSSVFLPTNTWFHIVGTYNDGTANIYLNGELDKGPFSLTPPGDTAGGDFYIGQLGQNDPTTLSPSDVFLGILDEVAVYDTELSAARIAAHYLAATIPEPSTVGLLALGVAGLIPCRRGRRNPVA